MKPDFFDRWLNNVLTFMALPLVVVMPILAFVKVQYLLWKTAPKLESLKDARRCQSPIFWLKLWVESFDFRKE